MNDLILSKAPVGLQNAAISIFNRYQWWVRQGGDYKDWFAFCERAEKWHEEEWKEFQDKQLDTFLRYAVSHSAYYAGINPDNGIEAFPILEKQTLIEDLGRIKTLDSRDGIVSYTGGTTGASMKVVYTVSDAQKRAATLDWFRSQSGWTLGRRTAWFSGKAIVRDKDIAKGICYRDDWLTKIRFFSTFHINERNFDVYWNALIDFDPEFIVGFPSGLADILRIALERGLVYPSRVKAVFPTAETLIPYYRDLFQEVLGATTRDQYASSEGAPFIVECSAGRLHILPFTGIFEVVNEAGKPAREGEIIVTAFHTHGTPLIRYRIGDRITLADESESCPCGCTFPLVDSFDGRNADFVWSPEHGRITQVNLSNSTKGVPGIITFRVSQNIPDAITVEVHGSEAFDDSAKIKFETELRKRTGNQMRIDIVCGDELVRKESGKFRIVENRLSSEQMVQTGR